MPTICSDNATFPALRMLLNDVAILTEECAWLDHLDRLSQALP
jgi:hypothetical protein